MSPGTCRNEKRIAKTNRLSSDSDFSIRKPERYSPAASPLSKTASSIAKAAPIAVHATDQISALRGVIGLPPWPRRSIVSETTMNATRPSQGINIYWGSFENESLVSKV